jgi:outer membrane lipoprotein carrier protein
MKYLLFILALGFVSDGFAQKDPEAKKILDAVSVKFKTYKTVTGSFSLAITNRGGKSAGTKKGTITLKGAKYKIAEGKGLEILSDGKNSWRVDKEAKEVTKSAVDNSGNAITPQKLFTNFYDKDFIYKLNGTTAGISEIEMTPTDKRKNFDKVYIYVDKAKGMITKAKILEKSGNVYTYSISNVKTNTTIADAVFTYDAAKYPGYELIED